MSISTRIDEGYISRVHLVGEDVTLERVGSHWRLSSFSIPSKPPQVFELRATDTGIDCHKVNNTTEYIVT